MLHKTKGIILRTVKYGETSVIVSVFTELFGLQSYLVNGVRSTSKQGTTKAVFFQPAAILDLIAYNNDFKNLQRLKEFKWAYIYRNIFSDVMKNAVAVFMIELLTKCLKQPEPNPELFYFTEDALQHLDAADEKQTANFALFFALHLPVFFGFRIADEAGGKPDYLDLQEGSFVQDQPSHNNYLMEKEAAAISHILKIMQPEELKDLHLNQETRRRMIHAIEAYYAFHIQDFGSLRTLPVLRELMN